MSDSEKQASDSEKAPESEQLSEKGIEEVKTQMKEDEKAKKQKLSTEEKQTKKKEANKEYYIRTRKKTGEVETQVAPKVAPKVAAVKTVKAVTAPVTQYEPSSPRSRMTQAYRELRIQEQERKSQQYANWFQ